MAVLKKTSSGRGVQFIDDNGVIYPTSLAFFKNFLYGDAKIMELPTRYAVPLPEGKFRKSSVYDPDGYYTKLAEKNPSVDTMKSNVKKDKQESQQYNKVVSDF